MAKYQKYYKYSEKVDKFGQFQRRQFEVTGADLSESELNLALREMSKTANQRLRQLEKSGGTEQRAYSYVETLHERNDTAITTTGAGEIKFNTNIRSMTYADKLHEFSLLQGFLSAKTSTIKGIKERYKKAQETIADKYGVDMSADKLGELFDTEAIKRFVSMYGSDNVLNVIQSKDLEELTVDDLEAIFNSADNTQSFRSALDKIEKQIREMKRKKRHRKYTTYKSTTGHINRKRE